MDNKVGDNTPEPAALQALLAQLIGIIEQLKAFGIILDVTGRKALLHARLGAEPHMDRVHDLAVKYKLDIDGIPLQGMANDLSLYTTLRPFQDAFRTGLTLADDTAGQAEGEAWEAFLAYYGTLCGMAKHQPQIAAELKPVIEFMATGPRPKG